MLAALDLCAAQPCGWVPLRQIEQRAGREQAQARADLAVLTMNVKRHFGRSNWPFVVQWAAGGEPQAYYSMSTDVATTWRELASTSGDDSVLTVVPSPPGDLDGTRN